MEQTNLQRDTIGLHTTNRKLENAPPQQLKFNMQSKGKLSLHWLCVQQNLRIYDLRTKKIFVSQAQNCTVPVSSYQSQTSIPNSLPTFFGAHPITKLSYDLFVSTLLFLTILYSLAKHPCAYWPCLWHTGEHRVWYPFLQVWSYQGERLNQPLYQTWGKTHPQYQWVCKLQKLEGTYKHPSPYLSGKMCDFEARELLSWRWT